jgi:hypothetical protein
MKTIVILSLFLLAASSLLAQETPGPRKRGHGRRLQRTEAAAKTAETKSAETKTTETKPETCPVFVDKNGDGIDDRKAADANGRTDNEAGKSKSRIRGCDRFTDLDGDGINDNRCNGLGPKLRRRQSGAAK